MGIRSRGLAALARSVSLVVCGPVRTAFLEKMEGVPGGALDGVDAKTRALFSHYQRHFQDVFREISQEPEEVAEVDAGCLVPSAGWPRWLGAWY